VSEAEARLKPLMVASLDGDAAARSRTINEAIRMRITQKRRKDAVQEMDALRKCHS